MRLVGTTLVILALVLAACASSDPLPPSHGGLSTCGLAVYPSGHDPRCQALVDDRCCPEEKACAANPECLNLWNCLMGCRSQTREACMKTCLGESPGAQARAISSPAMHQYSAVAGCVSHGPELAPPAGVNCSLP